MGGRLGPVGAAARRASVPEIRRSEQGLARIPRLIVTERIVLDRMLNVLIAQVRMYVCMECTRKNNF